MSGTVRRARWSLPLLLVLLVPRPGARAANPEPSAGIFDYDAAAPLNLEELSQEEEPDGILHDLTYLSPKGGRVTAYLVVPNRKGPFAGVVFQHWGFGDRREFLGEALRLARSGAASLLVDAPWARPEPWRHVGEGQVSEPEKDRELYVQTIVDLRRGIDLLVGRPDIDPERLAFVGHSYGATWGGTLAGVEKRFKAYVLTAGLPSLTDFTEEYGRGADAYQRIAAAIRKQFTEEQIRNYVETISPLEAVHYVGRSSPAAILMQFARWDSYISPEAARRYYDAASDPKEIRWYLCGHEMNDPLALKDRLYWLSKRLRLHPAAKP